MSPTYFWFGAAAVKTRSSRSGNLRPTGPGSWFAPDGAAGIPAMPCSRITRATRLWFTRSSAAAPSFSSAVIRGAPWVLVASCTARIRAASTASAAARCCPGRAAA